MHFIGCDPDTKTPSFAVVEKHDRGEYTVKAVWCLRVGVKAKGAALLELALGGGLDTFQTPWQILAHTHPGGEQRNELVQLFSGAKIGGAAIESQQVYAGRGKSEGDPQDLINVAQWAGVCAYYIRQHVFGENRLSPPSNFRIPLPSEWKGQRPKYAHQAVMLDRLGISYERAGNQKIGSENKAYCVPLPDYRDLFPTLDGKPLLKGDWKHVLDAVGLAIWIGEQTK